MVPWALTAPHQSSAPNVANDRTQAVMTFRRGLICPVNLQPPEPLRSIPRLLQPDEGAV